jgi:hypothetical protein
LKINKEKLIIPENKPITIYEVRQKMNENGTQASFIITATQRPDNKTGSGSQRSGSGSGEDKITLKGQDRQQP